MTMLLVRGPLREVLIPEVVAEFRGMRAHFSFPTTESPPAEPKAEQRSFERTVHGFRLIDEYAWLKAENWREVMRDPLQLDPAIRAYLQAENDYCEYSLADTNSLQETLFAEMKGRIKEDDSSVPDPDGPYAYYMRYRKEGQHQLVCRKPRSTLHPPSTEATAACSCTPSTSSS
jgi:oligopeptidase B